MSRQAGNTSGSGSDGRSAFAVEFAKATALSAGIFLLIAMLSCMKYGGLGRAVAAITEHGIYLPEPTIRIVEVEPGKSYDVDIPIVNYGDRPLRIIGSDSSCSCSTVERLPKLIFPGVDDTIKLRFKATSDSEQVLRVDIYTDDPLRSKVSLTVIAGRQSESDRH